MKYLLLFAFAAFILFPSCTKTKTNTVVKNDTTVVKDTIVSPAALIGTWQSSTGVSPIVFDSNTYTVQSNPSVAYLASPDTIYNIQNSGSEVYIYYQWAYSISANGDTLTLITRATGATNIYTKS